MQQLLHLSICPLSRSLSSSLGGGERDGGGGHVAPPLPPPPHPSAPPLGTGVLAHETAGVP